MIFIFGLFIVVFIIGLISFIIGIAQYNVDLGANGFVTMLGVIFFGGLIAVLPITVASSANIDIVHVEHRFDGSTWAYDESKTISLKFQDNIATYANDQQLTNDFKFIRQTYKNAFGKSDTDITKIVKK